MKVDKYDTATSTFIGIYDDISKLLTTPANHNDYAFYRYEEDAFHLLLDKYVYYEDLKQWVYVSTIKHEMTEKIKEEQRIEYKIEQLEKELKHLKKLQKEMKSK